MIYKGTAVATISPERRQSNALLRRWCAPVTGDVLSLGSAGDIDKEGGRYRDYFSGASKYVTSDVREDMGCDLVLDARQLEVPSDTFDAVFISGVLEHVDNVPAAVSECYRVLKPNGVLIVGVPFKQPVHRAPEDYWRFTEYGLRCLLRKFTVTDVKSIGEPGFPFGYWAHARKAAHA
jgi:SAM-dependent methyltransferase